MSSPDFARQMRGERLTTAEVIYYLPDHPALLQRFLWQTLDLPPDFPRICRFLDFWRREIDAVIHSVTIGGVEFIRPAEVRTAQFIGRLQ